jgi:hypothetical protein
MKSCCQYHSSIRPNGCKQGRNCPARKSSSLDKLFRSPVAVILFLLCSFSAVGTLEYGDIERAEVAAKQAQVKTARAN